MRHNQPDAVAVKPLSLETSLCTGADDCDLVELTDVLTPGTTCLKTRSLQRSTTLESSITSRSVIHSSSSGCTESAQSISSDVAARDAVLHEDALSCSPLTSTANADGDASSASTIPSPPVEEGLWMALDDDRSTGNVSLDVDFSQQSLEPNGLAMHCSSWTDNSKEEDCSLSQLDELLRMDVQELDAGLEDFCPSVLGEDFPSLESVATMPFESPPLCPFSECASKESDRSADEPVEDVSEVFARWLKDNAHLFSLSDLRHIKLKTSTIEDATRRLGGGKKGMLYFVKLILMWLQNHHLKRLNAGAFRPVKPSSTGFVKKEQIGVATNVVPATSVYATAVEGGLTDSASKYDGAIALGCADICPQYSNRGLVQPLPGRSNGILDSVASSYANHISAAPVCRDGGWNLSHSVNAVVENGSASTWFNNGSPAEDRNLPPFPAMGTVASRGTCVPLCDSLAFRPNTPAAATRAARKNRMERQRWSVRRYRKRPSFSNSNIPWSYQVSESMSHDFNYRSGSCQRLVRSSFEPQQGRKAERNLKLLFQKELKQSDVGSLGRIVVPKKAAETSLPQLDLKDGVNLTVEDMESFKVWKMRYRFWPNNKSRMYLLENTGDFVKSHNLKEGDFMMFYSNNWTNNYFIRGVKSDTSELAYAVIENNYPNSASRTDCGGEKPSRLEGLPVCRNKSDQSTGCLALKGNAMDILPSKSPCDRECPDFDDGLFAKLIEQSLDDVNDP